MRASPSKLQQLSIVIQPSSGHPSLDRYRSRAIGYPLATVLWEGARMKRMLHGVTALAVAASLSQPAFAASSLPLVTTQPDPPADVAPYFVGDSDPRWTGPEWSADDIAALRQKVKYVFVIFNENRSFDHEYGTLPGVNGLYSDGKAPRSAAETPGFTESYLDTSTGETVTVQPFRLGPEQNSTIKDSTDHSHTGLAAKMDVLNGVPKMDKFAEVEWS